MDGVQPGLLNPVAVRVGNLENELKIKGTFQKQTLIQLTNKQDKVSFLNYFLLLSYICSTSVVTVRTTEEDLTKACFFFKFDITSTAIFFFFFNDYCNSRLRWD